MEAKKQQSYHTQPGKELKKPETVTFYKSHISAKQFSQPNRAWGQCELKFF